MGHENTYDLYEIYMPWDVLGSLGETHSGPTKVALLWPQERQGLLWQMPLLLVAQPPQAEEASVEQAAGASSDSIVGVRVRGTRTETMTRTEKKSHNRRSPYAVQESLDRRELFQLSIKHYYEWLHAFLKSRLSRHPLIISGYKDPTQRPVPGLLYPLS